MKLTLKLEEFGMFLFGIFLFTQLEFSWWWFLVLILVPDFLMIGYLFNNKIGAVFYNIVHHKGIAVLLYLAGTYFTNQPLQLSGVILFTHSSMDRIFGA